MRIKAIALLLVETWGLALSGGCKSDDDDGVGVGRADVRDAAADASASGEEPSRGLDSGRAGEATESTNCAEPPPLRDAGSTCSGTDAELAAECAQHAFDECDATACCHLVRGWPVDEANECVETKERPAFCGWLPNVPVPAVIAAVRSPAGECWMLNPVPLPPGWGPDEEACPPSVPWGCREQ